MTENRFETGSVILLVDKKKHWKTPQKHSARKKQLILSSTRNNSRWELLKTQQWNPSAMNSLGFVNLVHISDFLRRLARHIRCSPKIWLVISDVFRSFGWSCPMSSEDCVRYIRWLHQFSFLYHGSLLILHVVLRIWRRNVVAFRATSVPCVWPVKPGTG